MSFWYIVVALLIGGVVGAIARYALGRSAFNWFLYGAILPPLAILHLALICLLDKTTAVSTKVIGAGILALFGLIIYRAYIYVPLFSDREINYIKQDIRSEFEKKNGVTVKEVALLRDGSQKLTGFVKLYIDGTEISKGCNAIKDGISGGTMWHCK
ncbi:hypothetical protein [Xanthobacter agilis]|uniref:Uncharacterized protein n=1 Tax=Xanthobacter agilis TaxID=47492 RepID=A0ABU0LAG8_XANAG|nr:hypothetical protein [Xanthobacter agilis]MDQ0504119.1 hypothetical protein [Xanthobacter agilis]